MAMFAARLPRELPGHDGAAAASDTRHAAARNSPPASSRLSQDDPREVDRIAGIRKGDENAFSDAFREYVTPLTRYASRIVSSDAVAQDIVMEVFTRLWRDRLALPADVRLAPYLKVSVRNSCINYLRHDRVEASVEEIGAASGWAPAMSSSPPMPDEDFERSEAKEAIRRAFLSLPPRMRLVMELRWIGEQSYKEISLQLGMPVKSVENYLGRAMRLLRERIAGA